MKKKNYFKTIEYYLEKLTNLGLKVLYITLVAYSTVMLLDMVQLYITVNYIYG